VRRLLLAFAWMLIAAPAASGAASGPCVIGTASPVCHLVTGKVTFVADGDTLDVDLDGDGRGARRTRIIGVQAMELTRYSKYAARRRGECHGVAAANRLDRMVRAAGRRARVASMASDPRTGKRLYRSIALRIGGRWVDVGATLLAEGHALWFPHHAEWAWNASYSELAQRAAAAGRRLWETDSCKAGPAQSAGLRVEVNWDADGDDAQNVNGEWFDVLNPSAQDVPLGGWWVRDSHLRRFTFPAGAIVGAGRRVRVHVGRGTADAAEYFWGLPAPAFENPAGAPGLGDGGYLFDPDGDLRAWDVYPCRVGC